jgi:hypothetical protein
VTGRKAVVIFVPFKLLKVVHKIQSRLVREVRTSARTRARHAQALHCATATSSDAEQQPRHLSRMSEDSVAAAAAAALQRGTAASVRCKAPASQDRAAAMRIAQRWVAAVAALRRQQQRKWLMLRRNASFPPGRTATCVASAHVAARAARSGGARRHDRRRSALSASRRRCFRCFSCTPTTAHPSRTRGREGHGHARAW